MRLAIFALIAAVEAFEFAPLSKVAQTAVKAAAPALIAGALVAGSAMPALAGDAGKGNGIFDGNCAACHVGGQNVIMPDKTLEQEVRRRRRAARLTSPPIHCL